ncbi:50S ribosomal protein L5 [Bacteriovoracaceae bacterium]|nr:50S ribosomal protein L5 [Bacteriovoracaceae bacterium]|tara:strand:+ start:6095 stop:6634 length:540 start_codon:yes stop_codon:yes gene_type:complete
MSRLKDIYNTEVKKAMQEKFSYKNVNQIPKVEKVIVNCVTKDCVANSKTVDSIMTDLGAITGQKPVVAKAKKSIASFKVREGQALGASVTLRGEKMYEFLDRLISISLPRVRDFRGVNSKAFDGRGNYTLGLKEQIIFPEINYDKIDKVRGMGISIVTTANSNEEGRELLTMLGMPFSK